MAGADDHRIASLEADNIRLRRLLDQRDAPADLRHRLRGTLALMRTLIRRGAETSRDVQSFASHLEDRLDALARAQAAIDEKGFVDLHSTVADTLLHYQISEGSRFSVSGPVIEFVPRAGQTFALALHELAMNSIEHGVLGSDAGRVDIKWSLSSGDASAVLVLEWAETPPAQETILSHPAEIRTPGIGTEVLQRMLAFELRAVTQFNIAPEGLSCVIRVPLPPTVARIGEAPGEP